MLFSLSNLKRRTVRDPDDELLVLPKLLHGRAALKLLEQALTVFSEYVGRPRSEYDATSLEGIIGDYRLGRCIEACLMTRFTFETPSLQSFLPTEQVGVLVARGLDSPTALRLALWDAANAQCGGAVPSNERTQFLHEFSLSCGLSLAPPTVDALLMRDTEASAVLTATGETPTPKELMRLYNRGAVQTLLAHSRRIEVSISQLPGHALKRLYFVAKKRGVYADIEVREGGGYVLVLYGPEEVSGTADKYGRRLAEVTMSLLRSLLSDNMDTQEIAATVMLILHDKECGFHLTREIMERLEYGPTESGSDGRARVEESVATYSVGATLTVEPESLAEEPIFDSMVEARLYREFKSLERQGYTHGWTLHREPDPLLAPGIVMIPDFAFVRGEVRVFMEIAGFWTPGYREKKLAKLQALSASGSEALLILAMPHDAVPQFAGLPFPTAPYKNNVRATDMLTLLDAHFGGRGARQDAAQTQITGLQSSARERGFVPEREVADALHAYTRSELLESVRLLDSEDATYVPGVGLLLKETLDSLQRKLGDLLAASAGRIELEDASKAVASLLSISQLDIEALLVLWPEWRIERPSLFEAYLVA